MKKKSSSDMAEVKDLLLSLQLALNRHTKALETIFYLFSAVYEDDDPEEESEKSEELASRIFTTKESHLISALDKESN